MIDSRGRCKTRRVAAVVAIAAMVISPAIPNYAAQGAGSSDHWNMTYHAGAAPIVAESKIGVTLERQRILLRTKKATEFAIPLDQITSVSSSVTGHFGRVSLAEAKFAGSVLTSPGACIAGPDYGCAAVILTSLLLIGPSYPIKTTDRLVQIVWRDGNLDEEIVLKVHKGDFDLFLVQLEKATAKPWKDLHTEWTRVQQELKGAEAKKIEVRLERKVRIGNSDLDSGTYQVVLLERASNLGELYFFPGKHVNAEELAAVASVEIAPSENEIATPLVDYNPGANGVASISTLRTPARTFRFPLGTPSRSGDEGSGVK